MQFMRREVWLTCYVQSSPHGLNSLMGNNVWLLSFPASFSIKEKSVMPSLVRTVLFLLWYECAAQFKDSKVIIHTCVLYSVSEEKSRYTNPLTARSNLNKLWGFSSFFTGNAYIFKKKKRLMLSLLHRPYWFNSLYFLPTYALVYQLILMLIH